MVQSNEVKEITFATIYYIPEQERYGYAFATEFNEDTVPESAHIITCFATTKVVEEQMKNEWANIMDQGDARQLTENLCASLVPVYGVYLFGSPKPVVNPSIDSDLFTGDTEVHIHYGVVVGIYHKEVTIAACELFMSDIETYERNSVTSLPLSYYEKSN